MGGTEEEYLLEGLLEWAEIVSLSARLVRMTTLGELPFDVERLALALAEAVCRYQEAHLGITSHNPY